MSLHDEHTDPFYGLSPLDPRRHTPAAQEHTPGAWHTKKENGGTVVFAGDVKIAWCPANHFDLDKKTVLPDEANARLIAAAPELLEACIMLCQLDESNTKRLESSQWGKATLLAAHAAIAKVGATI